MKVDFAHVKPDLVNFVILSLMIFVIITFWKFVDGKWQLPAPIHTIISGA